MAKSHNNFKPKRSRRSGLKKAEQVKKNLAILSKLKQYEKDFTSYRFNIDTNIIMYRYTTFTSQ